MTVKCVLNITLQFLKVTIQVYISFHCEAMFSRKVFLVFYVLMIQGKIFLLTHLIIHIHILVCSYGFMCQRKFKKKTISNVVKSDIPFCDLYENKKNYLSHIYVQVRETTHNKT